VAGEKLSLTAIAGSVRVTWPATGASRVIPVGQTLPVQGPGTEAPPPGAPAAAAGAPAGETEIPPTPSVPAIRDTVEGSPFK
jgi:hypothetical protein